MRVWDKPQMKAFFYLLKIALRVNPVFCVAHPPQAITRMDGESAANGDEEEKNSDIKPDGTVTLGPSKVRTGGKKKQCVII